MILKASQRGGGKQLALHLLKTDENEHVHVHELRGFTAEDLEGAFCEAYAVSRGTNAKQFLFSLSLNPPPEERVSVEAFESAIEAVEAKLGLANQPRAIVFHEKDGRRHAHAVWSRIDAKEMKAINFSFYKAKVRDVGREQFLEHGWQMPPGWVSSDSGKAFTAALASRGLMLARGDRRGHVMVDYQGEVYAVARYAGIKTKEVRSRLGDESKLPSVEQARTDHAARMTDMLRKHIRDADERRKREAASLLQRRKEIVQRQREERARLEKQQAERQAKEAQERMQRFASGFRGLWHRVTGKHAKTRKQNEAETLQAAGRDRAEHERLIQRQIDERRPLPANQMDAARACQTDRRASQGYRGFPGNSRQGTIEDERTIPRSAARAATA